MKKNLKGTNLLWITTLLMGSVIGATNAHAASCQDLLVGNQYTCTFTDICVG
jgi:hypothetical protein